MPFLINYSTWTMRKQILVLFIYDIKDVAFAVVENYSLQTRFLLSLFVLALVIIGSQLQSTL